MRSIACVTALIGVLATVPPASAQADFTGTWVLDASRSEGLPPGFEQTLTVKHSGDRIEVEVETKTPMGEQRSSDTFVLDDTEVDFQPQGPGSTGRRTARWSEDRNGFESAERATLQTPDGEVAVTATRTWTLVPGGEALRMELTIRGPQGEQKSTRVYARQDPAGD